MNWHHDITHTSDANMDTQEMQTLRRAAWSNGTLSSISEGIIAHPYTSGCIISYGITKPTLKWIQALQMSQLTVLLHRALTAPNVWWHLSVLSMLRTVFLVLKFPFSTIDHAILFYDLEHVCQQHFFILQCPKLQGKVTVMSSGRSHALWLLQCIKVH